jgi:hypothetical protein
VRIVTPILCKSKEHLDDFYKQVCIERPEDQRAEGVILRKPNVWYFEKNNFFKKDRYKDTLASVQNTTPQGLQCLLYVVFASILKY